MELGFGQITAEHVFTYDWSY